MTSKKQNQKWPVISSVMRLKSQWLELIVEKLKDSDNKEIEYWRVEKPSGILIIVLQNNKILLPKPFYRPGIQRHSLDVCGGRRINKQASKLTKDAATIVKRELKITDSKPFISLKPLGKGGWYVDSSFTNVGLDVFIAKLASNVKPSNLYTEETYPATSAGVDRLLQDIDCAQCRLALREWQAILADI